MTTPFVIRGAPIPADTRGLAAPNRLEIRDFVKNEKFFSLYIRALDRMQNSKEDDLLSFYQVGGIHGYPYTVWNQSGKQPTDDIWGGYCTHGSVLFPTWHRPYVALFEQVIQKLAADIAAEYNDPDHLWRDAAANLRQPYWDWPAYAVPPTEIYLDEEVTIIGFDGKKQESFKPNPFLRYRFGKRLPPPFNVFDTTLRHPKLENGKIVNDPESFRKALEGNERDIADKTWYTLLLLHRWPEFSNHTDNEKERKEKKNWFPANSLEGIHDSMHDVIGGNGPLNEDTDSKVQGYSGTMQWPEYAGFDPIFYLHHTNVDRLLSFWAALNRNRWVTRGKQPGGTVTIPPGGSVDSNTDLTPFWNTTETFWPSSDLEDTAALGYTYPEFNGLTEDQIPGAIATFIETVYGRFINESFGPSKGLGDDVVVPDWGVEISFKQFELGVSFAVMVFLGQVPEQPSEWGYAATYVGSVHAFVNSLATEGACSNCQKNIDAVTRGYVHLNNALLKAGYNLADQDEITGLVKSGKLAYRVLRNDNSPAALSSLKVTINHVPLQRRVGSWFPEPSWEHPGGPTAPGPIKVAF